jgi:hypothetical protein
MWGAALAKHTSPIDVERVWLSLAAKSLQGGFGFGGAGLRARPRVSRAGTGSAPLVLKGMGFHACAT